MTLAFIPIAGWVIISAIAAAAAALVAKGVAEDAKKGGGK